MYYNRSHEKNFKKNVDKWVLLCYALSVLNSNSMIISLHIKNNFEQNQYQLLSFSNFQVF